MTEKQCVVAYRVRSRPCVPGIAATAWLWSVCELGAAWGEEIRVENVTTRVARRPFLLRTDRKAVRWLRIESGAAPVFPASLAVVDAQRKTDPATHDTDRPPALYILAFVVGGDSQIVYFWRITRSRHAT